MTTEATTTAAKAKAQAAAKAKAAKAKAAKAVETTTQVDGENTTQVDGENTTQVDGENTEGKNTTQAAEITSSTGAKRPGSDTVAGKIWDAADNLSTTKQSPVSLKELIDFMVPQNFTPSEVINEYQKWRKFHNITGRVEHPDVIKKREERAQKTSTPRAERPAKEERNGVKRPYADTKAGEIWALADQISSEKGEPVTTKELVEKGEALGMNRNNLMGEIYYWRKFYGIETRKVQPAADKNVDELTKELELTKSRIAKLTTYQASLEKTIAEKTAATQLAGE